MRPACIVLTFAFLFPLAFSISQERTKTYSDYLRLYQKADRLYQQALRINTESSEGEATEVKLNRLALESFLSAEQSIRLSDRETDSLHFFLSLKTAELFHYFDSLPSAQSYYEKAIGLKSRLPGFADSFVFKPYLFSGNIYLRQNKLDLAADRFQKAEAIQVKYDARLEESERLYNYLGLINFQSGNYLQASNYFRKAANALEKNNPYYVDLFVNYQINFATMQFKLENYRTADSILKSLLSYGQHQDEIYNNRGLIQHMLKNYHSAIENFRRVHYSNALNVGLQNDMADAWLALKQLDSTERCLQKALAVNEAYNKGNTSVDHGLSFKIYGDLEKERRKLSASLNYYQKAMHEFYPAFSDTSIHSNPTQFTGAFAYIHLFHTLIAKAEAMENLYRESGKMDWVEESLRAYDAAFQLVDYIEKTYESDEARLFLDKSKYAIHTRPIDLAFELYQQTGKGSFFETAYRLDQKNKASVLVYNEEHNQGDLALTGLREEEQKIKVAITRLTLNTSLSNPGALRASNSEIGDLEIELGKIQKKIAEAHPVAALHFASVVEMQKEFLDDKTQLISYHFGEGKLTAFCITSMNMRGTQKTIYPGFLNDLNTVVRQFHSTTDVTVATDSEEKRLAGFLFDSILDEHAKRLIIIPDDELNYLPFEALSYQGAYLIESRSVQYQYSAYLLKKDPFPYKNASGMAFAPFTDRSYKDSGVAFAQLPYSSEEIRGIKGKTFETDSATKKRFLEQHAKADILHLATHAVATDSSGGSSYITFAPWQAAQKDEYLLYTPEIYNLSFRDNHLIILSACETGYGELVKGEGVMSLSRAFSYAGCPNIITSFWKANDQSTSYIGQRIHIYLNKGLPIDEALQQSKIDYLQDRTINPRMKRPAYWANMIFIGSYQEEARSFPTIWIPAISASVLLVLLFVWRYRTKQRKKEDLGKEG